MLVPWTRSRNISITWELERSRNSWTPYPRPNESETVGVGATVCSLVSPPT